MTNSHLLSIATQGTNIRIWRHGEFPMPEWVRERIIGGIEANGTFLVETDLGRGRVHLGNILVEQAGALWVRSIDDALECVEGMKRQQDDPEATANVGPGKVRQFGSRFVKKSDSRKPRYAPPIGSQPSIEWIHLHRLSIDGAYQRSTDNEASRRLIASIAAHFDWRLCAPLVVSRRADDTLAIIDGQHRWMAASRRDDIPQLPCCVFRYGSPEEEARMFILANRARKPMNRLDDYHAAVAAADDDALEIQQLVADAGLRIARNTSSTAWQPGEIAFTSSIALALRRHGAAVTSAVLTNMAEAFHQQRLTHGGGIFGGLVLIMAKPAPDFDPDRLLTALQTKTVEEWGVHAAGTNSGQTRAKALRDAIMAVYASAL